MCMCDSAHMCKPFALLPPGVGDSRMGQFQTLPQHISWAPLRICISWGLTSAKSSVSGVLEPPLSCSSR